MTLAVLIFAYLICLCILQDHPSIESHDQNKSPIRSKPCKRHRTTIVVNNGFQAISIWHIPYPHQSIEGWGRNEGSIMIQVNRSYRISVRRDLPNRAVAPGVPYMDCLVKTASHLKDNSQSVRCPDLHTAQIMLRVGPRLTNMFPDGLNLAENT